jgi:hypothetical protein
MWYKITNSGQSSLSVGKYLITKDPRISVDHYSFDHGLSPAKWDLHITDIHLSDAARYQCHVVQKDGQISARSNVKLVVEGNNQGLIKEIYIYTYVLNVYMREQTYLIDRQDNHG